MCSNQYASLSPPFQAEVSFKQGLDQDRQGNYLQAIAHYQQAIALNPSYVEAYNNLGCAVFKSDQIDRAIHYFRQGIALDPHRAELHNNLAQAYVALEQPDPAIASYQQALQCQPTMAAAHHNLGKLWHHLHHYERAIACFQKAIHLTPEAIVPYNDCAQAFFDWGKPNRAIPYVQRAIALQPQFVEGYCQMVESQLVRDALDQARHACATLLRSLQDNAPASAILGIWANTYRAFGDVSFLYERYDQAGRYYERSLQIRPQHPDLWERLADSYARIGYETSATLYYRQALQAQSLPDAAATLHLKLAQLLEKQFPEAATHHYHQVCRQMAADHPPPTMTLSSVPPSSVPPSSVPLSPDALYHEPYANRESPNRVYVTTADWVAETRVDAVNYVAVAWGTASPVQPPATALIPVLPTVEAFSPQCGGVSCGSCMKRLCSQFQPQWVEDGVYQCAGRSHPTPSFPDITDPPIFVVSIPRGRAWIAPQKNSWMICNAIAIITPDDALLGDLSRCHPWYLPGCSKHDFGHHRLFSQRKLPPVVQLQGTVAILSCLAGHVYYHWMMDLLPRLEILRRSGISLEAIDWFVVNNTNQPFQQETLTQLGIPPEKILASDEYPHIQAEQLIVPSFPGHLDWVPLATLTWLRQTFLPRRKPSTGMRLYLSRAHAAYRRVTNETELCDRLSPFGFITLHPETLSVQEQAELFAQADIIVAPHGSGLTNLAFCSPGTRVIELFSPDYVRTDYWIISQHLHLEHYYVIGEPFDCELLRRLMDPNPLTENVYVTSAATEGILKVLNL